jgi:hypothetical protein
VPKARARIEGRPLTNSTTCPAQDSNQPLACARTRLSVTKGLGEPIKAESSIGRSCTNAHPPVAPLAAKGYAEGTSPAFGDRPDTACVLIKIRPCIACRCRKRVRRRTRHRGVRRRRRVGGCRLGVRSRAEIYWAPLVRATEGVVCNDAHEIHRRAHRSLDGDAGSRQP